jgi:2-polyprenyl-3-methyl-5-hydroxy-6-metoxy-1,4-benzoquinol methylase
MSVIRGSGLAALVDAFAAERGGEISILEAGCGKYRHWPYPAGARVAGLDISQEQLDRNDHVQEKHLGDVQTWQTDRQWDVVASVYVLEHIADPRRAVANMLAWTRPGGLLVIAVPNARSLKGLVTALTPFAFHVWFYKHVYRRPHDIFPTVMDRAIRPGELRKQLADHAVVLERFQGESLPQPFGLLFGALVGLLRVVSLGRWRAGDSNYLLAVRKTG